GGGGGGGGTAAGGEERGRGAEQQPRTQKGGEAIRGHVSRPCSGSGRRPAESFGRPLQKRAVFRMIGRVVGGRPRTVRTVKTRREKNKTKLEGGERGGAAPRGGGLGGLRPPARPLREGVAGPLGDHVEQQRVPAERLGETEFHRGEAFSKPAAGLAQVTADMNASRQEIGNEDDTLRPLFDAVNATLLDGRLGQLEEGR